MARIKTAEKTFVFDLNPTNEGTLSVGGAVIDVGQVYSLVNRVSMRQGYEYVVQSLEIGVQAGGAFEACIMRLPEHWPCVNAWEKGMRLWLKQQNDAAEDAGLESTIARYRDFKVAFDKDHNFADNLLPSGFFINDGGSTSDTYEWEQSRIVIPNDGTVGNTTERLLHVVGSSTSTRAGLINAYAESRSRPNTPEPNLVDTATGGIFGEMFDVGFDDEEVVDNFQDRNNEAPYLLGRQSAQEYYPGGSFQGFGGGTGGGIPYSGSFVDILSINAGQMFNTDTCPGFVAPCGLIQINYNATGANVPGVPQPGDMPFGLWLKLTLAPGSYKGVLAQSMQEAN